MFGSGEKKYKVAFNELLKILFEKKLFYVPIKILTIIGKRGPHCSKSSKTRMTISMWYAIGQLRLTSVSKISNIQSNSCQNR